MSKDSQFNSTQNLPQDATKLIKLPKVAARYIEIEEFAGSDMHTGYFCYNCTYFMKPHHCYIVTDEGLDIKGSSSGVIAPHGICSLWMPNKKEIRPSTTNVSQTESEKSDQSNINVSATFSCDTSGMKFQGREELKQHTIQNHTAK
jgi:hypothetical protein